MKFRVEETVQREFSVYDAPVHLIASHFGFPASTDFTFSRGLPDDIAAIREKIGYIDGKPRMDGSETRRSMALGDKDFHRLLTWEMEGYWPKFARDTGPSCLECNDEIVLPIDLRRRHGENLHAHCYGTRFEREFREGTNYRVFTNSSNSFSMLAYHLRAVMVGHPADFNGDEPAILTRTMLDLHDIESREELEQFYWRGRTPEELRDFPDE